MSQSARRDVFVSFERWGWDERGWAVNTRRRYVLGAKAADTWLRAQGRPGIVWATYSDLRDYHHSTKATAQTRNNVRSSLVGFGAFAVSMGWRADNPAEMLHRLPVRRSVPLALEPEFARRVLVMADTFDEMHRLLVYVFLYGGLRKSEARMLEWSHVSTDGRWLRFRGKGEKERSVPLADPARDLLVAYRASQSNPRWVFPSPRTPERPISSTYVQNIVRDLGELCGVPQLHPHILRHTLATALLDSGSDLRDIQEFLGHASPQTTAIYTKVRPARLFEASQRLEYRR